MIYEFKNKNTGEIEEHIMRLSEYEQFKLDHPHLERVITSAASVAYEPGTRLKVDDGFREVVARGEEKLGKPFYKSGKW